MNYRLLAKAALADGSAIAELNHTERKIITGYLNRLRNQGASKPVTKEAIVLKKAYNTFRRKQAGKLRTNPNKVTTMQDPVGEAVNVDAGKQVKGNQRKYIDAETGQGDKDLYMHNQQVERQGTVPDSPPASASKEPKGFFDKPTKKQNKKTVSEVLDPLKDLHASVSQSEGSALHKAEARFNDKQLSNTERKYLKDNLRAAVKKFTTKYDKRKGEAPEQDLRARQERDDAIKKFTQLKGESLWKMRIRGKQTYVVSKGQGKKHPNIIKIRKASKINERESVKRELQHTTDKALEGFNRSVKLRDRLAYRYIKKHGLMGKYEAYKGGSLTGEERGSLKRKMYDLELNDMDTPVDAKLAGAAQNEHEAYKFLQKVNKAGDLKKELMKAVKQHRRK